MNREFVVRLVFGFSLAAFAWRAVSYSLIGSHLPAIFCLVAFLALGLAAWRGPRLWRLMWRVWAIWLILYGLVRTGLAILLTVAPVSSPHALEQTGPLFLVASILYLAAGVLLLRAAPPGPMSRPNTV
jgi:hypothetical protein